jgi:signal transduction histidine kinase
LVTEYGRYDADRARAIALYQSGEQERAVQALVQFTGRTERLRQLANDLLRVRRAEVTGRIAEAERAWRRALIVLGVALAVAIASAIALTWRSEHVTRLLQRIEVSSTQLALERARAAQAEKMSALGEMATAVAHEVLNPLTGVKTALQLLARDEPSDGVRETVSAVDAEIRRVEGLARRLMGFARPLKAEVRACDLEEILVRVMAAVRPEAAAHQVRLEPELNGNGRMIADPDLLTQVLINLTSNACQAMLDGGTVHIALLHQPNWKVIEVRDDGPGLLPEVAARLFQPFTTSKRDGHGLGLAISQNIMLAHGGRIEARPNTPAPGTTFAVWLPEMST